MVGDSLWRRQGDHESTFNRSSAAFETLFPEALAHIQV